MVTAVFENVPLNSTDQFDYLMNWDAWVDENPFKQSWGHFGTSSYIQLRADADPVEVEEKIRDFHEKFSAALFARFRMEGCGWRSIKLNWVYNVLVTNT